MPHCWHDSTAIHETFVYVVQRFMRLTDKCHFSSYMGTYPKNYASNNLFFKYIINNGF